MSKFLGDAYLKKRREIVGTSRKDKEYTGLQPGVSRVEASVEFAQVGLKALARGGAHAGNSAADASARREAPQTPAAANAPQASAYAVLHSQATPPACAAGESGKYLAFGDRVLDLEQHTLFNSSGGKIAITAAEFDLREYVEQALARGDT